jgi:hypothetical protein
MEANIEDGFDTMLEFMHLERIDLQKIMEDNQRRYIHSIPSKQRNKLHRVLAKRKITPNLDTPRVTSRCWVFTPTH